MNDRVVPTLEAMRIAAKDQTPEYKHIHTATGQRQSSIESCKQLVEDEGKKENPDQSQICLLNLHLNLATTRKMDIINAGYGTTKASLIWRSPSWTTRNSHLEARLSSRSTMR